MTQIIFFFVFRTVKNFDLFYLWFTNFNYCLFSSGICCIFWKILFLKTISKLRDHPLLLKQFFNTMLMELCINRLNCVRLHLVLNLNFGVCQLAILVN